MMKLLSLVLFLLTFNQAISQLEIPDIGWHNVGMLEMYELEVPTVDFVQKMSEFPGDVSHDDVMDEIIQWNTSGAIIHMPAGVYRFKRQVRLPSGFILKGEGAGSTKLIFELEKEQDCILAAGKMLKQTYGLKTGVKKGEGQIQMDTTISIEAGEYFYLIDQDEYLVESSWARGRTGQLIQLMEQEGDLLKFYNRTRRDFPLERSPLIVKVEMVKWVGVEDLTIVNTRPSQGQTSNIKFLLTENSWIAGVKSVSANYSHILLEYAANCEVLGCELSGAHNYGNGGKGYGITLQFGTGDCLISGNRLSTLRHAILLQAGANGNVIVENDSKDPFWTNVRLPEDSAGDIVLHGNYPYANLIENNTCQTIVIDRSHGKNGADNVFFDNVIKGYGIRMNRRSTAGPQVFINNVIINSRRIKGKYKVRGKHYEQYNQVKGKIKPKSSKKYVEKASLWS